MSDSLRERKGQCERCRLWREGVDRATEWTCEHCRLREENAALREQLAYAEGVGQEARMGELHAGEAASDWQKRCDDLRAQVAGLQDAVRHADHWNGVCEEELVRWQAGVKALQSQLVAVSTEAEGDVYKRDAAIGQLRMDLGTAIKRASDLTIDCGRLEGIAETANVLRVAAQRREDGLRALLYETREWLIEGGPGSQRLTDYPEFHRRLDAACGDGPTLWRDERPRKPTQEELRRPRLEVS